MATVPLWRLCCCGDSGRGLSLRRPCPRLPLSPRRAQGGRRAGSRVQAGALAGGRGLGEACA